MKKLAILFALIALSIYGLKAQIAWPQNGSNIYYNGGNVGIGTTAPACKFNIIDASNYQTSTGLSLGSLTVANNYAGTGSNIVLFENQNAAADNQIAFFTPAQYVSGIQAQRYVNGVASSLTLNPLGGNVGIGTNGPLSKLNVNITQGSAGGTAPKGLSISDIGTTGGLLDIGIDASGTFYSWLQSRHYNSASYFNLVLNPMGGNVGIGTTAPLAKLDVRGSASGLHAQFGYGNGINYITVGNVGSESYQTQFGYNVATEKGIIQAIGSNTSNYKDLLLNPNGGNIGIGTTAPACKFNIIDASNYQTSTGLSLGSLTVANNYAGTGSNIVLFENQNAAADNQLAFFTPAQYVSGIQAQRYVNGVASSLVLNPLGGNVGIGTTNPLYKLAVEGTIAAREVKVTAESWADFVFHPTYKLRTLGEVEQFIKTNNHLPEIPTAAEVKENGVSLGEMNAKLLQKVEELTLYMIELKKENEVQNQQIRELKEKNLNNK